MKRINYKILLSLLLLFGCAEVIETPLTGRKVTLFSPANNLITTDTSQTFYWEKLNDATKYELQVVSPRFDSIARLLIDTLTTKNTFLLSLNIGNYQWRVKALNNSTESYNSDIWNLKIH
jgi:hypothetical protein